MRKPYSILDDLKRMERRDAHGMIELLCEFPNQCESAWTLGESFLISRRRPFQKVVFLGMGGSAIGGDLVRSLLEEEISCPILVNRAYHLPALVDSNTLVFAVSYSGNTEETLSAYEIARKRKAQIIAISSGGKLQEWALRDRIPHLLIPSGLPPRTAIGYLFFIPYVLIRRLLHLPLDKKGFEEMLKVLRHMRKESIGPHIPSSKNPAKQLAGRVTGRIPVIHGSAQRMEAVVTRFRTQISENAKQLVWSHVYPELDHNEIVGWHEPHRLLKDLLIVLLRDGEDHPRVQKRMAITKRLIQQEENVEIREVWSSGRGILARTFSLIYLGDFLSFYLAILNRVDPTPVERIERLKKALLK